MNAAEDNSAGPLTIREALHTTSEALKEAGIESASLDARLLVAEATGASQETLIGHPRRGLSQSEEKTLQALAARRILREPVAYILGRKEFWGLEFTVSPAVLVPRPDSETLVEAALSWARCKSIPLRILDFGTGSGCLLLSLLHELPSATGVGVDISEAALEVARQNAQRLGLYQRTEWIRSEWGTEISEVVDIIISNPPYIAEAELPGLEPEVREFEPKGALISGADGLDSYRAIRKHAERLLKQEGIILLEVGASQALEVAEIFAGKEFTPAGVYKDLAGVERCLAFCRR